MRNATEIKRAIEDQNFNWLGRDSFIENFSDFLLSEDTSRHVCIDGVWGSGKTTTVLGIINQINRISSGENPPLILYLDSWKLEHYEHPLFALLKVIKDTSFKMYSEIIDTLSDGNIKFQGGLSFPFFHANLDPGKETSRNKVLHSAEYIDILNEMMVQVIRKFKEEKGNKLIIFIDELDRARPDFALKTIEMFHHLQDDLPTHIVYSVDMNQLNSIIKHYYGYEYNTEIFTHKVFDEIFPLNKLSNEATRAYINLKMQSLKPMISVTELINMLIKYCSSNQIESLRTINRLCLNLEKRLRGSFYQSDLTQRNRFFLAGRQFSFWGYVELFVILETLIDPITFRSFLKGRQIELLADIILEYKSKTVREDIWLLILESYKSILTGDYESKNVNDLTREDIIKGLKNIFNPPSDWEMDSIFSI